MRDLINIQRESIVYIYACLRTINYKVINVRNYEH